MKKYKSIIISKKGGPEVLQTVENEFRPLDKEEVLIKIQACGVGRTDIGYRRGEISFAPKIPFVPGYEILGIVDAVGEGVTKVAKGDRVAALTGHGGYSEYIYLGQEHLVHVPTSLDPAEAVIVVLNYVTAYQMLHRLVKVKAGDKVLIIGATGGVGTALLQLGKLANLVMYGTATKDKFKVLEELGATPIDYKYQRLVDILNKAEAKGIDFVFDGVGGKYGKIGLEVLRKGGKLVEYTPAPSGPGAIGLLAWMIIVNLLMLPNRKSIKGYGISASYKMNKKPFMEDLSLLFKLLEEGKIKPIIAKKLPILEAAKANELLESGQITGNIVLLAPELF